MSLKEVEYAALDLDIFPMRYGRNRQSISAIEQIKLLDAHIAIVGCGGLGGHIAEILTRIGIGRLTLIDHDVFEEHNLNRQNFSTFDNIGEAKAKVVKANLSLINPLIQVKALQKKFDSINGFDMIRGADVVIDALDDPKTKLQLAYICQQNRLHFVHGAVGGMSGEVSVDSDLKHLYRNDSKGSEIKAGNLSCTVTHIASLQASEAVKLILKTGEVLQKEILMVDLLFNDFTLIGA